MRKDISSFIEGFDDIKAGCANGDSNLIIMGNVKIQKVLGRDPQFTNQEEFDELMEADEDFVL